MSGEESRELLANARRTILTAGLLGVAAACAVRVPLGLEWSFVSTSGAVLSIGGLLLLWQLVDHHPFARLGIANTITLGRGVLVALLAGLVGAGTSSQLASIALCVGMLAAALDGLDGWTARRTKMSSSYGARFDMETDALLILVLSLLAWQFDKAGAWVLASGSMRYAFITAAWRFPWMNRSLPASHRRKTVAVVQLLSLLIAVAPFVPRQLSQLVCAVALVALGWSFCIDTAWLRRQAADPAS